MDHQGNPAKDSSGVENKISLEITPTGGAILVLSIFLFFAAFNTGNNTLHLLSAGSLTLFIIGGGLGYYNLRGLRITWEPPPDCFAGNEAVLTAMISDPDSRQRFNISLDREFLPSLSGDSFFPFKVRLKTEKRGQFPVPETFLFSLLPFGIVKAKIRAPSFEFLVYPTPKIGAISGEKGPSGRFRELLNDPQGEYWMHRPYIPGEDSRFIHWQVSARLDMECVVTMTLPRSEPLRMWIDFSSVPKENFEEFLEYLCGLFLSMHDFDAATWVWFPESPDKGSWVPMKDPEGLRLILQFLAKISQEKAFPGCPPVETREIHRLSWQDFDVVTSASLRSSTIQKKPL